MSKNLVETLVGAIVLFISGYFLYYAYNTTQTISHSSNKTYTVTAKFDRIDGLKLGSDVKISGIKVGKVISQNLDNKTFQANLIMNIIEEVKLPSDSSAEIIGNGLLGEKYISIAPGSDSDIIPANGAIEFTQSPISIEGLIGKFLFNSASSSAKKEVKEAPLTNSTDSPAPIAAESKPIKN